MLVLLYVELIYGGSLAAPTLPPPHPHLPRRLTTLIASLVSIQGEQC